MPVTFLSLMGPLASPCTPMSSSRSQNPHCQGNSNLGHGEHGPLLVPSPTMVCSRRVPEVGGKAFSANSSNYKTASERIRLWFMSPSGTSLLYSRLPASLIGALNTLISACLAGAHSSLKLQFLLGEVLGS